MFFVSSKRRINFCCYWLIAFSTTRTTTYVYRSAKASSDNAYLHKYNTYSWRGFFCGRGSH